MKLQKYINHIALVVDSSASMGRLKNQVTKVLDTLIARLVNRSKTLDQETRISIYLFNSEVECIVFDRDVLRMPSISEYYNPAGMTALIDGTLLAINDLRKMPELYGDHSNLIYCISDGENNISNNKSSLLAKTIASLPDNYTLAAFAPDAIAVSEYKKFGFPAQNISIWDINNDKGIFEVGEQLANSTDVYMDNRSNGVRGTKNLFEIKTNISQTKIKSSLEEINPNKYQVLTVRKDGPIKEFAESWTKERYRLGSGYYQLGKRETVQANKNILVKDKKNGRVYGGDSARQLLGLPNHEVKVAPAQLDGYDIFIQSNAVNRRLVAGTQLIILS